MRFELGICEIYTPSVHGLTDKSSKNISSHFLLYQSIELEQFIDNTYQEYISTIDYELTRAPSFHPLIRNIEYITHRSNYIKLDIIENISLEGGEIVCCIKTIWIKIIQRLYKRIYKERKRMIQLRKGPSALRYKEIYGKWPKYCLYLPEYKFRYL